MKNARTIFWLFACALVAIGANVFLSWRTPAARMVARRTLLDPSIVPTAVSIVRSGSPETVIAKRDRWTLIRPYSGTVDAQVVLRLLDALAVTPISASMTGAELAKLGRSRADFGLEKPALRIMVSAGTDELAFDFGIQTPTSNGVYVALAGSESVLVVPDHVRAMADLGADAFRERDVFPYEPDFVRAFDLRKAGETPVSFVRSGDGWKVGDSMASSSKVRAFLSRLTGTCAVDFFWPIGTTNEETSVSEARLAGYGLDAGSALSVTLCCLDGIDRRILIGADAGEGRSYALVHDGGAIVSVDSALKTAVLEGTLSFVDARLFPLEASSVSAYTISDGDVTYVLARGEEGSWRLDSPVAAPADSRVASALLNRILALTPSDRDEQGVRVAVSTNQEPMSVSSKALLGEERLVNLRSGDILWVDAALVKRLVSTPGGKTASSPTSVAYSRERKEWSDETDEGKVRPVAIKTVERLLTVLSPLKASSIVTLRASSADLARYGLEKPFHTISVDQEKDGAVRRNIFIGSETKNGRYATVGSSEAIFVLPKRTVDVLVAPLLED